MRSEFKHIIDQHNGILYKIGRVYTRQEEEFKDLYQEMLIQLWKSFPKFKGESKITTWIYKVALNTALSYKKKNDRKINTRSLEDFKFNLSDKVDVNDYDNKDKIKLLYKCIQQLNANDRAIILLQLEGNSYDEIAEITGLKKNHIGVKLNRIKAQLYKLLKAHDYGRI